MIQYHLGAITLLAALSASIVQAADPNWDDLPYTTASQMQAVDASGAATFSVGSFPIKFRGVILNTPADMADASPRPSGLFDLGAIWQVFVQSDLPGDTGGIAAFMAQNYGNVPPNLTFPGGVPTPEPSANYSNEAWQAQVDRLNNYQSFSGPNPVALPQGHTLQAGDLVEIRARAGLSYGGKFNVNERHTLTEDYASDPGYSFDIVYLGSPGLPDPIQLELADIWNESANAVAFDATRQSGVELYQSTLVSLNNIRLAPGANWTADNGSNLTEVIDADGRAFKLHLGVDSGFSPENAPAGWFSAVGIFNQEAGSSGPFTQGYELWVMSASDITLVPEPATLFMLAIGALALVVTGIRRKR